MTVGYMSYISKKKYFCHLNFVKKKMFKEVENLALLEPCVEKVSSRNKKKSVSDNGWNWCLTSLSKVFRSYQDYGSVSMKGLCAKNRRLCCVSF